METNSSSKFCSPQKKRFRTMETNSSSKKIRSQKQSGDNTMRNKQSKNKNQDDDDDDEEEEEEEEEEVDEGEEGLPKMTKKRNWSLEETIQLLSYYIDVITISGESTNIWY
jgi:hypothetical protein